MQVSNIRLVNLSLVIKIYKYGYINRNSNVNEYTWHTES